MKTIQLRPSQFIYTYGPGAILEGPDGSVVILSYEKSNIFPKEEVPDNYKISIPGASRLSKRITENSNQIRKIGIFRIPTNAEEDIEDSKSIYDVIRFPNWSLCHETHQPIHGKSRYQVLYDRTKKQSSNSETLGMCPVCFNERKELKKYQGDKQVFRFIRICPEGHLDDISWNFIIHDGNIIHEPKYFLYIDEGSEFDFVRVCCSLCDKEKSMREIFNMPNTCRGRHPFKETFGTWFLDEDGCGRKMQIVQKNALNVFLPEVLTSMTLPKEGNLFYEILNYDKVYDEIVRLFDSGVQVTFENVYSEIKKNYDNERLRRKYAIIRQYYPILKDIYDSEDEKQKANEIIDYFLNDIIGSGNLLSENEIRDQELSAILNKESSLNIDPRLIFGKEYTVDYLTLNNNLLKFKIISIPKIELLTVQLGFRRLAYTDEKGDNTQNGSVTPNQKYKFIDTSFTDNNDDIWYCGVRNSGEGLFITLTDFNQLKFMDNDSESWKKIKSEYDLINNSKTENQNADNWSWYIKNRKSYLIFSPIGVFLHTLSHRIIKAISEYCGYSSASIRERIYLSNDESTGSFKGGILIYSSTPGDDGTFGGLVGQAKEFSRIIGNALDNINICSNDPICEENKIESFHFNGAACYACSFLSETSCEFGNTFLDRNVILKNI